MNLPTARDKYISRAEYAIFRTMVLIIGLFVTCLFLYDRIQNTMNINLAC